MSTEPDAGAARAGPARDFIDEMCLVSAEDEFEDAAKFLSASKSLKLNSEKKLRFYALFKQATVGPCTVPKPGLLEMVQRAKWSAWNELGRMPRDEAISLYLAELEEVAPSWREAQLESLADSRRDGDAMGGDGDDDAGNGGGGGGGGAGAAGFGVPSMSRPDDGAAETVADEDKSAFDWVSEGRVDRMKEMVRSGRADVNAVDATFGLTLLQWAVDRDQADAASVLLEELGAEVDARDESGQTALHYAVICERPEMVRLLLGRGANPDAASDDRTTPRQMATDGAVPEMLALFR